MLKLNLTPCLLKSCCLTEEIDYVIYFSRADNWGNITRHFTQPKAGTSVIVGKK
jgi:hypothetical protein